MLKLRFILRRCGVRFKYASLLIIRFALPAALFTQPSQQAYFSTFYRGIKKQVTRFA
jgi:hypothetical protein